MSFCGGSFQPIATITFFQNFWGAPTPDIAPIRAFAPQGQLGAHVTSSPDSRRLVLLIRASLFQRYPNAMVYAAQAKWTNGVRKLTDTLKYPVFGGTIGST